MRGKNIMSTVRQWMNGLFKLWDAARRELLRDPNVTLFERCADHDGMSEIPPIFAAASTMQSFRQTAVYHDDVHN